MLARLLALFLAVTSLAAAAADYPERPVRIVVPFAPGGGTDLVMRAVADRVAADWKASVIVENKPGAGTTLGGQSVAASPADGYTLLANTASFLITPHLMSRRPYDAAADFVPVARVASSPHVLVIAKQIPADSLPAFVAWVRGQPAKPTFASFGVGSSSHLGFEILRERLGLEMIHVPYRGAAPAIIDILGGRVDAMLADLSTVAEHVKSGNVKALAVTGNERSALIPDVPSSDEAGLQGFRSESWFGIMVRSGTLPQIVARWNEGLKEALAAPDVEAKLAVHGISPAFKAGPDFGAFLALEDTRYLAAIRRSGAKLE